ncbi:MAG: sulfatase-like hydrolase/transferase, partial [bacterium]|nr:sulfatase-like hydrolase/transferase [bacterium]
MTKILLVLMMAVASLAHAAPNVVLIITDDQGYGDIAAHGNPVIKTPNLDKLHARSVRLTNFHVSPTCAPTRSALMTGRFTDSTGTWHTIMGRSLLNAEEVTLADSFRAGGYRTGIFGKWHLGDNYPFRPQDRGFDEVLVHGGGGVWQTPDYFTNDYFDDHYYTNGTAEKYQG